MPQRKQIAWAQLRVGLLVVVSLIILGLGIFFISGQVGFLSRRYTLKTYFASASGVHEGSEVHLAGIEVGNVKTIQLSPYSDPNRAVEVVMKVTRRYQNQIHADSVANIETAGLLGDSYIDISRGGPDSPTLPNNGELKSEEQANIKAIVQNANDFSRFPVTRSKKPSKNSITISTKFWNGPGTPGCAERSKTAATKNNPNAMTAFIRVLVTGKDPRWKMVSAATGTVIMSGVYG